MPKQQIFSGEGAPPQGPYSPGLKVGDFVFVSGQGPLDSNGKMVGETIEEQTIQVLENIRVILEAAGASMADVVKCTSYLRNLDDFARYNQVYTTYFPDPKPTRTTIGTDLLMGMLVEIDAIAYVGDR